MTKRRGFSKAIEDLEKTASDIGSDVRERFEEELEQLEDLRGKLNEGLHETKDKAEREIQKNPWAAVGIVAFVFFVIGFLLGGRRRD